MRQGRVDIWEKSEIFAHGELFWVLSGLSDVISPEMDAAASSYDVRYRIFENR